MFPDTYVGDSSVTCVQYKYEGNIKLSGQVTASITTSERNHDHVKSVQFPAQHLVRRNVLCRV